MLRMLLHSTAPVLLLLLSINAQAQRYPRNPSLAARVHGQVRYAQGARPVEFVLVRLESFSGGIIGETITDRNGSFIFTGLRPELYIVSVRTPGFREIAQQVDLRTQISDYVQLQLVANDTGSKSSSRSKQVAVVDAGVPPSARAEFERGRVALLQENNSDVGILHLENAVRLYPKYLEALLLLGTAYMDKKDWTKAESTLRQVLVIEPGTAMAHFALGELYLRQRKYLEAEKDMLAGIKLDAKSVPGHLMLGRLYYEQGNLVKAGPQVGTALQLNPKFAPGHLLAGKIYLRARQAENALVEFDEYLRLEPNGEFSEQARQAIQRIKEALAKR